MSESFASVLLRILQVPHSAYTRICWKPYFPLIRAPTYLPSALPRAASTIRASTLEDAPEPQVGPNQGVARIP